MALYEPVLLRDAEMLEWKGLIAPAQSQALESLLHDAYVVRLPKPSSYRFRSDLVCLFNTMAKETFGNNNDFPVVKEFGSFLMDMFSADSDLDLSINFSNDAADFPRDKKKRALRKFAKKLYNLQAKGHVFSVQQILNARVPIVKVTDFGTGIECDVSVENKDGIARSEILRMVSSIDERFKKLGFLMKAWAKAHKINSSRDRTLNSLSIIYLVAFHLQTRYPPILPPFSAILRDGTDPASVWNIVQRFLNYGMNNRESLAELFVTLLTKLESVKTHWPKGLCASVYEGSWIYKTWKSGVGCISIEDFTERSENVARAVGTAEVKSIYHCIYCSLSDLTAFRDGRIHGVKLMERLFGNDSNPSQEVKGAKTPKKKALHLPSPPDSVQTKKMRFTGGWGEDLQAHVGNPNTSVPSLTPWTPNHVHPSSVPRLIPLQPPHPPQNALGFGGSFNLNPTVQLPNLMPNYVPASQIGLDRNARRAQRNFNRWQGRGRRPLHRIG